MQFIKIVDPTDLMEAMETKGEAALNPYFLDVRRPVKYGLNSASSMVRSPYTFSRSSFI